MSQSQKIPVEKVTKPIQLLAAWLTGLVIVDGMFLTAAKTINEPAWITGALSIAAIINVPAFLAAIFLLQTKFRPEMQEDSFYSKYLESKTGLLKDKNSDNQISNLKENIYTSNTKTLEIVSELQNEINNLSIKLSHVGNFDKGQVISSELEQKIKDASNASSWNQYNIRINKYLNDYEIFKLTLARNNIPVHGIFGNDELPLTDPPEVLIGCGFTALHIRKFLEAIKHLPISLICYPDQVDEYEDYHKEILLGAYNSHKGLTIGNALNILNKEGDAIEEFYSALKHK